MWCCCVVPFVDYVALLMQYHVLTVAVLLPNIVCGAGRVEWLRQLSCQLCPHCSSCHVSCVRIVAVVMSDVSAL